MRVKSIISFNLNPKKISELLDGVEISFKKQIGPSLHVAELFTDTKQYEFLVKKLEDYVIPYSEITTLVSSQKEMSQCDFLRIYPNAFCGYPQPEERYGYELKSYDLGTGCPDCGNGKIQIAPLQMKSLPKNGRAYGIHWIYEIIVSSELQSSMEKEQFSGIEYLPIIDFRSGKEKTDYVQLFITGSMPRLSTQTALDHAPGVTPCHCGRRGFMIRDILRYDRSDCIECKDFNKTMEWLGGSMATWQLTVISKRAFDFFKKQNVMSLRFEPVGLIS